MNRVQFISELEALLEDIPAEERDEALQYYRDYFDDAGPDKEEEVLAELKTPQKTAEIIKQGLRGRREETSEYRETGYMDTEFEEKDVPSQKEYGNRKTTGKYSGEEEFEKIKKSNKTMKIILIILLAVLLGPIVIPLGLGFIAIILGLCLGAAGLLVGLVCTMGAIAVSGVVCIVAGIFQLIQSPVIGMMIIGIGAIMLSLGIIITALFVKLCIVIVPGIIRLIVSLFQRIFHRKQKEVV